MCSYDLHGYAFMDVCVCVCVFAVCVCLDVYVFMCMIMCVYMFVCVHVCIVCMYMCVLYVGLHYIITKFLLHSIVIATSMETNCKHWGEYA